MHLTECIKYNLLIKLFTINITIKESKKFIKKKSYHKLHQRYVVFFKQSVRKLYFYYNFMFIIIKYRLIYIIKAA